MGEIPAGQLFSLCPYLHSLSGLLPRVADTLFLAPRSFLCSGTHVVFLDQAYSLIFMSPPFPSPGGSVKVCRAHPRKGSPQCGGGPVVSLDLSWWKVQGAMCMSQQPCPGGPSSCPESRAEHGPVLGHLWVLTLQSASSEASPRPCCSQPGGLSVEFNSQTVWAASTSQNNSSKWCKVSPFPGQFGFISSWSCWPQAWPLISSLSDTTRWPSALQLTFWAAQALWRTEHPPSIGLSRWRWNWKTPWGTSIPSQLSWKPWKCRR